MPEKFGMALLLAGMILFVFYAVLILLYKRWWDKVPDFTPSAAPVGVRVSVIVPARNEEKNLPFLLAALERQSYPPDHFEVIVVDDDSTDRTAAVAKSDRLDLHLLSIDGGSKKMSIDAGIRVAKGELIVTTDADCIPPVNWLLTIADFYRKHHSVFIAAPVAYHRKKGLLAVFQTLDFLTLQGITAGTVTAGFHSMCNGANLAYKRSAFLEVKGFEGIDKLASGDDMLLMHKMAHHYPGAVHYLRSTEAIVTTDPVATWKEFFWQRYRWASKSSHYGEMRISVALFLVYVFNLYFIVLGIAGCWDPMYWNLLLIFWVTKTAIELPFVHSVAKYYGQSYLVSWFFLMQPLHIVYVVVIGLVSQFGSYYWKGRKLK